MLSSPLAGMLSRFAVGVGAGSSLMQGREVDGQEAGCQECE